MSLQSACFGALAIIQLFAVAWHYIPLVRQQVVTTAEPQAAPAPAPTPAQQTPATACSSCGNAKSAKAARRCRSKFSRRGFRSGPEDAGRIGEALARRSERAVAQGVGFERLEQPAEAVVVLEEILKYPGLPSGDPEPGSSQARSARAGSRVEGEPAPGCCSRDSRRCRRGCSGRYRIATRG